MNTYSRYATCLSALLLLAAPGLTQKKNGPKASVTFASSWEDAVREARLLHLPIVVHNHGFY